MSIFIKVLFNKLYTLNTYASLSKNNKVTPRPFTDCHLSLNLRVTVKRFLALVTQIDDQDDSRKMSHCKLLMGGSVWAFDFQKTKWMLWIGKVIYRTIGRRSKKGMFRTNKESRLSSGQLGMAM